VIDTKLVEDSTLIRGLVNTNIQYSLYFESDVNQLVSDVSNLQNNAITQFYVDFYDDEDSLVLAERLDGIDTKLGEDSTLIRGLVNTNIQDILDLETDVNQLESDVSNLQIDGVT